MKIAIFRSCLDRALNSLLKSNQQLLQYTQGTQRIYAHPEEAQTIIYITERVCLFPAGGTVLKKIEA